MLDLPEFHRNRVALIHWGRVVRTVVLGTVLGAVLAGCTRRSPESGGDADRERTALVERAQGIRARLESDSTAYRALEPEWKRLVADVKAWQARTGRDDIRTGFDSVRTPAAGTAARDNGSGESEDCPTCAGYHLELDRICFLKDEGDCMDLDEFTARVCTYECIWIGSRAELARQEQAGER